MSIIHQYFHCPFCGQCQSQRLEECINVIFCDIEVGGCDKRFVVELELMPKITVYTLQEEENKE